MYLFFDTETNGLPKNFRGDFKDVDNWPRVIQLAFVMADDDLNEVESFCELIRPDGWTIPEEKFWIENGYSTAENLLKGVPAEYALNRFVEAVEKCQTMVAHNVAFDTPVLSAEMLRYGIKANARPNKLCTMKASTNFCAIPTARGGYKWPKLEELHQQLFGEKFDNAHDALADVRATLRCFRELRSLGVM